MKPWYTWWMATWSFVVESDTHGTFTVVVPESCREQVSTRAWQIHRVKESRSGVVYARAWFRENGVRAKKLLHRFVWELLGKPPAKYLDHIDGNPLNNAEENLRAATASENQMNRRPSTNNTSGHAGVCRLRRNGRWRAFVGYRGKKISLGEFTEFSDAVAARLAGEERYFPGIRFSPEKASRA